MATSEAVMRIYLRDAISVSDLTVGTVGARHIDVQEGGLIAIKYFLVLDKTGIKTLCEYVCKLGGKFSSAYNPTAMITNPGYIIPDMCEKRLKAVAYTANIYDILNHSSTHEYRIRARINLFEEHSQLI